MNIQELNDLYLQAQRDIGYSYKSNESRLKTFIRDVGEDADILKVTDEMCITHLFTHGYRDGVLTMNWFRTYSSLNGLFTWAIARGLMKTNPLPVDKPRMPEGFIAYVYSNEELKLLFGTAGIERNSRETIPAFVMQTALKINFALGLRVSETLNLNCGDVHLDENYAIIRGTKFDKTRIVPFNDKVSSLIWDLKMWYMNAGLEQVDTSPLFLDKKGNAISRQRYENLFVKIRCESCISRSDGSRYQPRLCDLRHTFATRRIEQWYKEGKDLNLMLPVLSTYLGHVNIQSTQVYLHMTMELMKCASDKFYYYVRNNDNLNV